MQRMTIQISDKAAHVLSELAKRERRDPREQAGFLLEKTLEADAAIAEEEATATALEREGQ